jgi:hypothetical protein
VGDSGGAVFVYDMTTNRWELAGINLAIDGPFSTSSNGSNAFDAAMFDTTGLFVDGGGGNWVAAPNPSAFYATEIAAHKGFIESVIMQPVNVVSRKTHGNAGTFDVDLPETGAAGIECRSGGATNDYMLVFAFTNNVSVQGASVTSGSGSVTNFNVIGNQVMLNLNSVTNAQTIIVTLKNVSDGLNTSDVQATMGVLLGDVNASRLVDGNDVSAVQSHTRQPVNSANFRYDVNADGLIDGNDVSITQGQTRTALPSNSSRVRSHVSPLPSKPDTF